jgi:beta-phosphoglucomutase-like phosphatase (HAD superfamily)
MHLVIFDVDGTLVDSDELDGQLYAQAVRDVLGVEVDPAWNAYSNVTDSGILDEILEEHALPGDRAQIHMQVRRAFYQLTRSYVARCPGALREIPGATDLIDVLRSCQSVAVAIATGGWRETAMLKLHGIGLDSEAIPLATASDSSDRCAIITLAGRRALRGQAAKTRTYFGDGAWDKKAAADLSYRFVAVGSGVAHDMVVPDLRDHTAILKTLGVNMARP